jgi:hypothetical protein
MHLGGAEVSQSSHTAFAFGHHPAAQPIPPFFQGLPIDEQTHRRAKDRPLSIVTTVIDALSKSSP